MNGEGELIYENGNKYKGRYSYDVKHGFGVYTWANGKKIEGRWLQGKQEGEAKYTNEKG